MSANNPISLSDLFNFNDKTELQSAIADIRSLKVAYEEFLQVVIGGQLKSLASQQDDVRSSIKSLLEESAKLNITNKQGQDAIVAQANEIENLRKQIEDLNKTKKAVKDTEEAQKNSVDGLNASLRAQLTEYNKLDPTIEANLQRMLDLSKTIRSTREAMSQLKGETKVATQSFTAAAGSYQALDAETKQLVKDLKSLEGGLDGTNVQAKALQARIFENTGKLKAFDSAMNQNFRNVGNYASAFNGTKREFDSFGNSVQQIGRELPSIAISLNTFFLAISNNLPQLFDEIAKVRNGLEGVKAASQAANAELAAQTSIQNAAKDAAQAAEDSLSSQVETIISSVGASHEQAVAIKEQIAAQAAEIKTTGEASVSTLANTEALLTNVGATTDQIAVVRAQTEATLAATIANNEATLALQRQAAATLEANAASAAAPTVLKRILSSIFSFNTALTLGVLALTLFGGKLIDFFGGESEEAKKAAEANKKYTDSLKEVDRVSQAAAQTEVARLTLLARAAADVRNSMEARIAAIDELKKRYPEYFANLEREVFLNGRAAGAIRDATRAIFEKASGEASFDKFKKVGEQVNDLKDQLSDVNGKIETIFTGADNATKNYINITDKAQKLFYEGKKNTEEYIKLNERARFIFQRVAIDPGAISKIKELRTQAAGLSGQINEAQIQQQNLLISSQKSADAVATINDKLLGSGRTPARIKKELEDVNKQLDYTNINTTKSAELLVQQRKLQDELAHAQGKQSKTEIENKKQAKQEESEFQKLLQKRIGIITANEKYDLEVAELAYARSSKGFANEKSLEEERLEIIRKYADQRLALYPKDSKGYITALYEKTKAEEDQLNRLKTLNDRHREQETEAIDNFYKHLADVRRSEAEAVASERELSIAQQVTGVNLGVARQAYTQPEGERLIHEIRLRQLQQERDATKKALEEIEGDREKYNEKRKILAEQEKAIIEENANFEIRKAEEVRAKKEELISAGIGFASSLVSSFTEFQSQQVDDQMARLQEQYDADIEMAGNNTLAKKRLQENFAKRQSELRREQAEAQKFEALFNIAVSTAEAVIRSVAASPKTFGLPFSAFALATGVAQAAVVAARPLPRYYTGREKGKKEWAEVNDRGFEFIERNGKYRIEGQGERTVTELASSDRVIKHEESVKMIQEQFEDRQQSDRFVKSLLAGTGIYIRHEEQKDRRLAEAISAGQNQRMITQGFKDAVADIPVEVHNFDEDGYRRFTKKKNTIIETVEGRQKMGGNK